METPAIREYDPARDQPRVLACLVELQNFERALEPTLPDGEEMASRYFSVLLERCAEMGGRVFVGELDGVVAGFVCVLGRVPPEELHEEQAEFSYVTDLVVLPSCRRRGLGRALLGRAEVFARDSGARALRVGVLASNRIARDLYGRLGFAEYHLQLIKRLS